MDYVDFQPDKPLVSLPSDLCLEIGAWLHRQLPPSDFLMGSLISTNSRVLLTAPTGLGKTTFVLAIGFRAAIGHDFLHWKASRAARVLYIDGEMSRRQLSAKIADEIRRCGHIPDNMWFLSREDAEDMQPLDTPKGQAYVDAVIERVGGVDLVLADNVQSLLTPDESFGEQAWSRTLPWIKSLTRRCIGQVWIHHTGDNETKSFGTSTRAWQMDTSILMERVTRDDVDIAFALKFLKARERSPDNRADFEPVTITLQNDVWSCDVSPAAARRKEPSPGERIALEALHNATIEQGEASPKTNGFPSNIAVVVKFEVWRQHCYLKARDITPDGQRKAFGRAADNLLAKGLIGIRQPYVWIIP